MAALHAQQLCMNSSADTLKYKIKKLINFHNLDLWSSITRALAEHPSIEIFILVKLNQFTALRDGPSHINKNKHEKEEEEKTAQEVYFQNAAMCRMNVGSDTESLLSKTDMSSNGKDKENWHWRNPRRKDDKCAKQSSLSAIGTMIV
ncbi:hypothetical protein BD309DRAFT_984846 [Dichomitus squalens]|nr:hypothetical protein BD309DRAFT_984846 [Dichomitus squalens]